MMQRRETKGARFAGFRRSATGATAQVYRPHLTNVARAPRSAVALALIGLAACGGRGHGNTYEHATHVQEACCEHLGGPGRDQCLAAIPRVAPEVQGVAANQASYACVVDNFVCDPGSGHATPASVQAQFDCVDALGR